MHGAIVTTVMEISAVLLLVAALALEVGVLAGAPAALAVAGGGLLLGSWAITKVGPE